MTHFVNEQMDHGRRERAHARLARVGFSADEEWLAVPSSDFGANVWRVSNGERIASAGDPGARTRGAMFYAGDSQVLLADSSGRLTLWEEQQSNLQGLVATNLFHGDTVYQSTFLADGRVATGSYDA